MNILKLSRVLILLIPLLLTACSPQSTYLDDVTDIMPQAYDGAQVGGIGNADMIIQVETSFPETPTNITVYNIEKVNPELAKDIAKLFGLEGDPAIPPDNWGHYNFSDEETILEVYLTGRIEFSYKNNSYTTPASFPSTEQCIQIAQEWLKSKNLYPDNISNIQTKIGSTIGFAEKGSAAIETFPTSLLVKFFTTINGYEVCISSASVRLGGQGEILDMHSFQPTFTEFGTVSLKTPEEALNILEESLKNTNSELITSEQVIFNQIGDKLIINNVSLQYINNPDTLFLQPIYAFEGIMYSNNEDSIGESFIGYVDAINH